MFTDKFLRSFYNRLNKESLPQDARRSKVSLYRLPSNRPDIVSLFESMTPYFNSGIQPTDELLDFNSGIQPTDELLELKMTEGLYILLNTDKNLYASLFDFTDPWKIDIMSFMEQNYTNDLSLEEMANYTGRSLATFKRDFSKVCLILSGTQKVTDICYSVGFKNLSHFSKAYKGLYGCSPAHSI